MEDPIQPPVQNPVQPPVQTPAQPPIQQPMPPVQQTPQVPPSSPPTTAQSTPPSSPSSKGLLIAVALLFLALISGILVYFIRANSSSPVGDILVSPAPTQKEAQTDTNKEGTLLPTGTNDAQLNQDIQTIDTKIGTAESNLGNVDQGLNDQSVNLTE